MFFPPPWAKRFRDKQVGKGERVSKGKIGGFCIFAFFCRYRSVSFVDMTSVTYCGIYFRLKLLFGHRNLSSFTSFHSQQDDGIIILKQERTTRVLDIREKSFFSFPDRSQQLLSATHLLSCRARNRPITAIYKVGSAIDCSKTFIKTLNWGTTKAKHQTHCFGADRFFEPKHFLRLIITRCAAFVDNSHWSIPYSARE